MAPTGLARLAAELGPVLAPDYTCECISAGTQDMQPMIKRADGAPVLFVRRNSKNWGLFRPPEPRAIKIARSVGELADSVLKELGVPMS
jgi:hypothetical protein